MKFPPEVWKTKQFNDIQLRHCNVVYNQNPINKWMKGYILAFPKKSDLRLAKNYLGIILTFIAAKIYKALLRNLIKPKIDNILRKNQNGFRRNRSTTSQILTIRRILEGVRAKNLLATILFVDFTKAFDSIHRGKMEQILLAYDIPKETVAAIKILYRNTKVKVRSPDGDTDYFDIVAGVLQKTITDADYADDIAILTNAPAQAEIRLHSLERAAAGIGLQVNAYKTEYMYFNQTGDISTLGGSSLKLIDKFTNLGGSVSSTEKHVTNKGMDCYRLAIGHMEVRPDR